jgi:hypothetical protein
MEKIILDTVRLTAADYDSHKVIERLYSDGVSGVKDSSRVLINVVIVSTVEGVDEIQHILKDNVPAKKNIIVKLNSELNIPDKTNIDSVLEFQSACKPYCGLKSFLKLYKENVETHGLVSFDFNDFFSLIRGRNMISILSYEYNDDISNALDDMRDVKAQVDGKYYLAFSVTESKYNNHDEMTSILKAIKEYIDTLFADQCYWNFRVSHSQVVTLFTSIAINS